MQTNMTECPPGNVDLGYCNKLNKDCLLGDVDMLTIRHSSFSGGWHFEW